VSLADARFLNHLLIIISSGIATNSLTVADRSSKNGWTPHGPPLEQTLKETIDQVVKEQAKTEN
jgi:hypothetical protein